MLNSALRAGPLSPRKPLMPLPASVYSLPAVSRRPKNVPDRAGIRSTVVSALPWMTALR